MHRPFSVSWEAILPGDPQQVWEAITARCAAWIWEIDYEPRVGGAERGLSSGGGTVTAWEPPHHFETRAERADGWRNRLDYRLEPHPDGTRVRFLHESVADAGDWERIYAECVAHTDFYRHSLAAYVAHFAGRTATYVGLDAEAAFATLCAELGLPRAAAVGDTVRLQAAAGLPAIEGTLDYLTPDFLGVRADDLLFRVYGRDRWGDPATVALHLFDPAADAAGLARGWREWLETHANSTEAVA
ncbi:MAG TPA: SRPBCC domain-containing protein [Conexibacter sp.]|nr:SRPBCC domain-containing protein [Conexibacter sp.]